MEGKRRDGKGREGKKGGGRKWWRFSFDLGLKVVMRSLLAVVCLAIPLPMRGVRGVWWRWGWWGEPKSKERRRFDEASLG